MPRCPYKGEKVRNLVLGIDMHLIATYRSNGKEYGVYSDMLPSIVKILNKRVKENFQNTIAIDGSTGSGKSTLGIELCKLLYPDWQLDPEHYVYFQDDFLGALANPSSRVILVDEATNVINNLDYRKTGDNQIVVLLDLMRSFCRTTVLATPNFFAINKRVRDDHVDMLLAIPDQPLIRNYSRRGFYEVYLPKRNLWAESPYWILAGAGVFPPLDPETDREYKAYKLQHQLRKLSEIRGEA